MNDVDFRGWVEEWRRWVYGYYEQIPVGIGVPIERIHIWSDWNLSFPERIVPGSAGQYVGTVDDNDKRIYEGDIVRVSGDDIEDGVYEVIRNRYTWAFDGGGRYMPFRDYSLKTGEKYSIEVIDNIYEKSNKTT
jgi:hypothetical protein